MVTALSELASKIAQRRELPDAQECRRLRLAAGATLDDVARAVGVSKTAVLQWEAGRFSPRDEHLGRYLEVLRVLRGEGSAE
jgi:transcriptional regulator with XRE-family HTH domain